MASNKQRKSRGTVLGLALMAMLAFGALSAGAAQAAPTWSIDGKAFLGEEAFASKSPTPVTLGIYGVPFTCDQSAQGSMFGGDEGQATVTFNNCTKNGTCVLQPLTTNKLKVDLVEVSGNVHERFAPASGSEVGVLQITGFGCALSGNWPLTGSFAAWFNVKQLLPAVKPSLRYSAMKTGDVLRTGTSAVTLTGDTQQWLNGEYAGFTWWWTA